MLEADLCGLAVGVLESRLQRVNDLLGCLFVNIDGDGLAVLGCDYLNALCGARGDLGCPFDAEVGAVDADGADTLEIGGSRLCLVSVQGPEVILCQRQSVL